MLCKIPKEHRPHSHHSGSLKMHVWVLLIGVVNEPLECSSSHFKQHVTAESFLDMTFIKYIYWFTPLGKKHLKKHWQLKTLYETTTYKDNCCLQYNIRIICLFIFTFHRSKLGYENLKDIEIVKGPHSYRSCFIIWVLGIFIAGRGDEDL